MVQENYENCGNQFVIDWKDIFLGQSDFKNDKHNGIP